MPYIPHTDADIKRMLDTIGVNSIEDLFDEIPKDIIAKPLQHVPTGKSEMETLRIMSDRASQDSGNLCFIGAGMGNCSARRVLHRVHAVPGGSQPGHAAGYLRIPVDDRASDGDGCVER